MPTPESSRLYVEGTDDLHVVKHLLQQHGIDALNVPEVQQTDGKEVLLDMIKTVVQVSSGRSVGFMLDADDKPQDRWSAVRGRLQEFELDLPQEIPADGYITNVNKFRVRVGVWLMPDNRRIGALEQFLEDLVAEDDSLLPIAKSSTENALNNGATFPGTRRLKAILHTWLAWQERPGLPYGSAINAKFFRHDSSAARAFVAWYKRLFLDQP